MDGKQLCCIRDIISPATLYYVLVLKIGKEITTDALFIILHQVTTIINHNKKIINTDRLYSTKILLLKHNCEIIMHGTGSYSWSFVSFSKLVLRQPSESLDRPTVERPTGKLPNFSGGLIRPAAHIIGSGFCVSTTVNTMLKAYCHTLQFQTPININE